MSIRAPGEKPDLNAMRPEEFMDFEGDADFGVFTKFEPISFSGTWEKGGRFKGSAIISQGRLPLVSENAEATFYPNKMLKSLIYVTPSATYNTEYREDGTKSKEKINYNVPSGTSGDALKNRDIVFAADGAVMTYTRDENVDGTVQEYRNGLLVTTTEAPAPVTALTKATVAAFVGTGELKNVAWETAEADFVGEWGPNGFRGKVIKRSRGDAPKEYLDVAADFYSNGSIRIIKYTNEKGDQLTTTYEEGKKVREEISYKPGGKIVSQVTEYGNSTRDIKYQEVYEANGDFAVMRNGKYVRKSETVGTRKETIETEFYEGSGRMKKWEKILTKNPSDPTEKSDGIEEKEYYDLEGNKLKRKRIVTHYGAETVEEYSEEGVVLRSSLGAVKPVPSVTSPVAPMIPPVPSRPATPVNSTVPAAPSLRNTDLPEPGIVRPPVPPVPARPAVPAAPSRPIPPAPDRVVPAAPVPVEPVRPTPPPVPPVPARPAVPAAPSRPIPPAPDRVVPAAPVPVEPVKPTPPPVPPVPARPAVPAAPSRPIPPAPLPRPAPVVISRPTLLPIDDSTVASAPVAPVRPTPSPVPPVPARPAVPAAPSRPTPLETSPEPSNSPASLTTEVASTRTELVKVNLLAKEEKKPLRERISEKLPSFSKLTLPSMTKTRAALLAAAVVGVAGVTAYNSIDTAPKSDNIADVRPAPGGTPGSAPDDQAKPEKALNSADLQKIKDLTLNIVKIPISGDENREKLNALIRQGEEELIKVKPSDSAEIKECANTLKAMIEGTRKAIEKE